ncbi:MAG: spore cortex biosynthesis protein YabQ, partial [[Eubacterium] siraeum]
MNEETSLMWQIACFCVCGALLGVLYEPLRILRLIIPHHSFITGVEDTAYLSLCGVVLFGLSMETGNGNFRLSYLLAAFVGGVVYFLTAGRLIKIIYSAVIKT